MSHATPRVELPPPIDAGPSPLLPEHLVDLFFRPARFFGGQLALGKTPYAVLVSGWKPRLWFLILPCVFYLVAVGAFAALFAYLESQQAS